jgi:hypothetical protein
MGRYMYSTDINCHQHPQKEIVEHHAKLAFINIIIGYLLSFWFQQNNTFSLKSLPREMEVHA